MLPCVSLLQVSGFPNMNAVALEDGTGQTFVGTFDFLKVSLGFVHGLDILPTSPIQFLVQCKALHCMCFKDHSLDSFL